MIRIGLTRMIFQFIQFPFQTQNFVDMKRIRAIGGNGGDGCISFMSLFANENAGPDGADGGNGGHVVLQASASVNNLAHVTSILKAQNGKPGAAKDCHGSCADHLIVKVPVGTIVKSMTGKIVGDLGEEGMMFIAARGGAGGKGNSFFTSNVEQAPQICEYGARGEEMAYITELRSMAHLGLVRLVKLAIELDCRLKTTKKQILNFQIGLPNAGKSTLLRAITRARPKVAPYAFTTLQPHIGVVHYDDYEQVKLADLPGLIPGSHQNRGLGIQFLKHVERCAALLFMVDCSCEEPWKHYESLRFELGQFSKELEERHHIIIANKIDVDVAQENFEYLKEMYPDVPIIPISAKMGTNINELLSEIRRLYDLLVLN